MWPIVIFVIGGVSVYLSVGHNQGYSPKKKWGTPETRLRQRFTVTQSINSAVLKLSYTAFQ